MHKTQNLDDGYMGSGTKIIRAITKYGIENFAKEYIHIFESEKEMIDAEKEIVNEDFVKRDDTYNINLGGLGSWYNTNKSLTKAQKADIALIISKCQTGKHNSQFGKIWIFSEEEKRSKKIFKEDLDFWLEKGWKNGRKTKFEHVCKYCSSIFDQFAKMITHTKTCKPKIEKVKIEKVKCRRKDRDESNMSVCNECLKSVTSKGLKFHIWYAHNGGKEYKQSLPPKKINPELVVWNKGKSSRTDERLKKMSESIKKRFADGTLTPSFLGKNHTDETKKKMSEQHKKRRK